MKNHQTTKPLFLGLTHIGQIYSIAWTKKIGPCAVFDYNKDNLLKFKQNKFTLEERNLSKLSFDKRKINFCNNSKEIINFKNIFFTYDTPLDNKGNPNIKFIESKLKKLLTMKFDKETFIIITSQVYPGFMDYLKKKYLKKNNFVKLIYMVDTLKMGSALNRFLKPEQLVFGCEKKNKKHILSLFKKFNCKKYIKSYKEAELIKVSLNLYLYFSVNFSNIINNYSKQIGINYLNIIENLKKDKRIGSQSYIYPSPAVSGGHLERDVFYIKKNSKNLHIRKIFSNFEKFNTIKNNQLKKLVTTLVNKKIIKLLIIGISYKDSSFSLVNSIFQKIFETKKIRTKYYDSYFKENTNKSLKIIKTESLKKGINDSDIVILNYCNDDDFVTIKKKFFKSNLNKYLINISLKYQNFFDNNKYIYNYFSRKI